MEPRDFDTIRALSAKNSAELEAMKNILDRLDRSLFGGGMNPGVITKLEQADKDLADAIEEAKLIAAKADRILNENYTQLNLRFNRVTYLAMGVIVTTQFLSGSGVLSFKTLLSALGK